MKVWFAAGAAAVAVSVVAGASGSVGRTAASPAVRTGGFSGGGGGLVSTLPFVPLWLAADSPAAVATPAISAPPDAIVGEADGTVDFVVSLSAPGLTTVSVNYATADSSANNFPLCNSDYIGANGTLTFAPGETTKIVSLTILDCPNVEGFESFNLNLSGAVNGTIARASTRIGIVDNDTLVATPRLFVRDAMVDEKDGTAYVSVLLGGPSGQASASTVTVDYATADGTATAGSDYTSVSGTLSFAPGQTVKTVPVSITDDATVEGPETFRLTLSNPTNATIADGTSRIVIGASDGAATSLPSISAPADAIVGEGDGFVDLAVSLAVPGSNPVSVNYATADSSAGSFPLCNSDYIAVSGTLNFAPGETTKVVRVDILDCANVEGFESFTFGLSSAVNGVIARARTRVGIVDNDTLVATPKLIVRGAVVDEKDGLALVPVILGTTSGQASTSTVTVDYATADATATAGADYTSVNGTLSFAPGQTVKTIIVPIADDAIGESAEAFNVVLSNATNATIAGGSGSVVIGASDAAAVALPAISLQRDTVVREPDGYVDLVVTLSVPGASTVSVDYATADNTASSFPLCNSDYIGVSGTLNFAPGETTKVVRVDILDCPIVEQLEFFTLNLSGAVNGTIGRASMKVLIIDGSGSLTGIDVTPANPSIATAADQQFIATGTFSDAETFGLTTFATWTSATPAVATLSADGLAHGISPGTSTISAAIGAVSGSTVLTVVSGPAPQTISFAPLPNKTYGDVDFTVSATASSGLSVSFAASGGCTVSVAIVHITAADSCTITASQPGDANFSPATPVPQKFSIAKANQTITVGTHAPGSALTSTSFTVAATAPGGAVSYSSSGACTNSDATFTTSSSAGTCTVKYDQHGNTNYNAATQVTDSVTVTAPQKTNQTIAFAALANKTFGDSDFVVSATASSGLSVSFAASGNCTLTTATVHVTGAGSCTITASQAGNAAFNAANPIPQTFSIAKATQAITFGALGDKTFGDPDFAVGATASSGLTVSFAGSGNCTVSGTTVHLTGAGSCTVTAAQTGDANYNAATPVPRTFSITAPPKKSCKVPNVVGKTLAAAKNAIKKAHCRTGKVTYAYPGKKHKKAKKGIVISQSRPAGRVLPANTKINLVVSRGRKR